MKSLKILLICSCASMAIQGYSYRLSVKIESGHLNMREEPTVQSLVVYEIPKDSELIFLMQIHEKWIKTKYIKCVECDAECSQCDSSIIAIGWVHSDYVDGHFLRTTLLDTFPFDLPDGKFIGIDGCLVSTFYGDEAWVRSEGKELTLIEDPKNANRFVGNEISIEMIVMNTDVGYKWSSFAGFLRIQKGDKVEYVFVQGEIGPL